MAVLTPAGWPYLPKLLLTVAFLRIATMAPTTWADTRTTLASACFALYLVAMLTMDSFTSPWLPTGWLALAAGFALAPKSLGPKPIFFALLGLLLLHALAIPGSILWGSGNWELTAGVVMWMAPAFVLYVAGTGQTLSWLAPAFLIHAGLIIHNGFTNWHYSGATLIWDGYSTGLASNSNLAAGFIVLGLVYALAGKSKWLALPLLMALLFTGSRWGIAVGASTILIMALAGHISGRALAVTILGLLGAFLLTGLLTPAGYTISGHNSFASIGESINSSVGSRLAVPHLPSLLPAGIAEHPGLHNVPLRVAFESGVLAAALWVAITGWALIKGVLPKGRVVVTMAGAGNGAVRQPQADRRLFWWLLLALAALSMLDYYTWMGHLGGFWWLLVGLLVKSPAAIKTPQPQQQSTVSGDCSNGRTPASQWFPDHRPTEHQPRAKPQSGDQGYG